MTHEPTIKERDADWMPGGLPAGGAVFHFDSSLAAYGDVAGYDLGSVAGLLKYVVDFVNGRTGRLRPEARPVGRERLRQLLRIAVSGPSAPGDPDLSNPSEEFLNVIRQRASGMQRMDRLERVPGGAEWRHHRFVLDPDAFYTLVASLLMSEENRAALGQCRHTPCGKFFIVQQPAKGRPNRYYCPGSDCQKDANDAGAAMRQRDRRARLAALKILGKGASGDKRNAAVKRAQLEHPGATAEQLAHHAKAFMSTARKHK